MALAIYMDVHVPAAVTMGLRRRSISVLTAQEDNAAKHSDEDLLRRATGANCVLFSQDQDFLRIAAEWIQEQRPFSGIIYAHQFCAGIGQLVADIELVLNCFDAAEMQNRVIHLPLQ